MSLPRLARNSFKDDTVHECISRAARYLPPFIRFRVRTEKKYVGETKNKDVAVRQFHVRLLMIYTDALPCFVRAMNDDDSLSFV